MKFKYNLHVVIDNFKATYKLLLYRIVLWIISGCVYYAILSAFFNGLSDVSYYTDLRDAIKNIFNSLLNGDFVTMGSYFGSVSSNFDSLIDYMLATPSFLVPFTLGIIAAVLVFKFLQGLGNYTASCMINERMAMHSDSRFFITYIKNLGKASLYNVIYVPLSLLYDAVCVIGLYFLLFKALGFLPVILLIVIAVILMVLLIALKMTFTTDWLPALICGKKSVGSAMKYTFSRKSGDTLAVYIYFAFSCVAIFGFNVAACLCTIGAGIVLSVPLSYIYLLCFEFVNYYTNNDIKFFIDRRTIIKPEHEKETTHADFLRGE